jgi:hypothetical protein
MPVMVAAGAATRTVAVAVVDAAAEIGRISHELR